MNERMNERMNEMKCRGKEAKIEAIFQKTSLYLLNPLLSLNDVANKTNPTK